MRRSSPSDPNEAQRSSPDGPLAFHKRHAQPELGDHTTPTGLKFEINVGSGEKIRHDALTSILQLLEARYELAETVLFHRAKLSITAPLDRCLLEIGHLYQIVGVLPCQLHKDLEGSLLEGSDDALPDVLKALTAESSDKQGVKLVSEAVASARSSAASATDSDLFTSGPTSIVPMEKLQDSILSLIEQLRNRSVYKMLYKLKFGDIQKSHLSGESSAKKVVDLYADFENRRRFLHGLETLCNLPACSLAMYCPPTKMNAKVADVNLLIEDDVVTFAEYDQDDSQSNLTRAALSSRMQRFTELWSTQVFLRRDVWAMLDKSVPDTPSTPLTHLKHVIRAFLFQSDPHVDLDVARMNIQPSVYGVRGVQALEAARSATTNYDIDQIRNLDFPSGLSFLSLKRRCAFRRSAVSSRRERTSFARPEGTHPLGWSRLPMISAYTSSSCSAPPTVAIRTTLAVNYRNTLRKSSSTGTPPRQQTSR